MIDIIVWEAVDGLHAIYVRHYPEEHEASWMQPCWDKKYFVDVPFQAGDGV